MGEFFRPWVKTQRLELKGLAEITLGSTEAIEITKSSSVATGMVRSMNIAQTQTADIGNDGQVEVLKATLNSEVNTGAWAAAISGVIDFGTAGHPHGVAAAISGEMIPPNGTLTRGSLYAMEAVFGCQSGSSWGSAGPVAFQKYENYGTKAYFSANAFLWHLIGETPVAGGLVSEGSTTVRTRIGTATRYLVMSEAENSLTLTGTSHVLLTRTYTLPGSSEYYAMRINSYPTMVTGGTSRGLMILNECLAGTLGVNLIGITAIAEMDSTKRITGFMTAGTFSLINAANAMGGMGCVEMTWKNTATSPSAPGTANHAYMIMRDYSSGGGTVCSSLFWFGDITVGSASATALFCEMGSATTASHVIRFMVKNTPYWILCDSTPPA